MNFLLRSTVSLLCLSLFAITPLMAVDSDDEDEEGTTTSISRAKPQAVAPNTHTESFVPPAPSKKPLVPFFERRQFDAQCQKTGIAPGIWGEVYECVNAHTKNLNEPVDLPAFLENFPKEVTFPQEPLRGEARQAHFEKWVLQGFRIKLKIPYVIWAAQISDIFGLSLQERGQLVKTIFELESPIDNPTDTDLCAVDLIEKFFPEKFAAISGLTLQEKGQLFKTIFGLELPKDNPTDTDQFVVDLIEKFFQKNLQQPV